VLACERATPEDIDPLDQLVAAMAELVNDFPAYRQADVRLHVGLAESTGSASLVTAMTEAQGAMSALIDHIPHPPEVLAWSNAQHERLLATIRRHDAARATRIVSEHLQGTVHVLAGLLPAAQLDFRPPGAVDSPNAPEDG
jgi:GntR family transcriptional repressor for pyruvate dehydrogenase complex